MKPQFFKDQDEFRNWLEKNHLKETEIFVGFYKINSGKASMTWSQSVDQALCFGWIDGVKYSIDDESYKIRFTPRKKNSIWSAVNINKFEKLKTLGLLKPEGIASFNLRKESRSKIYAFENEEIKFSPEFEKIFKSNKKAWDYFQSLAPSYRKPSSNWVMSAKQESTRLKRLMELIAESEVETNKWKNHKYKK
ncbi:MAG: YdeI/OmpD-associated family protein [Saprospiraceae bacterium]|nr:YdeI/OmpD-associated family protein [Saprospiraceae bacterium]MBK9629694.1 YdeI/OmpD-associated family protein [Saprospiraceae bacterium]